MPRWRYWYIKLQSNQLLEANQQHKKQDIVQEFFENFNFKIFQYVIKKSRIFTLGLLLLAIIVPFLYVRYTTPIYETSATLIKKKEIKNNKDRNGPSGHYKGQVQTEKWRYTVRNS